MSFQDTHTLPTRGENDRTASLGMACISRKSRSPLAGPATRIGMDRGMNRKLTKRRMPLMLLLSAVAAITLGFGAFFYGGGSASAQTPAGGSPTASGTEGATPSASPSPSASASPSESPSASPTAATSTSAASPTANASAPSAPSTGSGVASTSNSSELPIVLGGLAAIAGGAALFGVSLKKRN